MLGGQDYVKEDDVRLFCKNVFNLRCVERRPRPRPRPSRLIPTLPPPRSDADDRRRAKSCAFLPVSGPITVYPRALRRARWCTNEKKRSAYNRR